MSKAISVKMIAFSAAIASLMESRKISTVRALDAINSELARHSAIDSNGKLGNTRLAQKSGTAKTSEVITTVYEGPQSSPIRFKSFNDGVAKLEKTFPSFQLAEFPAEFKGWLAKLSVKPEAAKPAVKTDKPAVKPEVKPVSPVVK
jgi:hypothetical protein